jgi:hypothetical protein
MSLPQRYDEEEYFVDEYPEKTKRLAMRDNTSHEVELFAWQLTGAFGLVLGVGCTIVAITTSSAAIMLLPFLFMLGAIAILKAM